jgi:hypothetical protein
LRASSTRTGSWPRDAGTAASERPARARSSLNSSIGRKLGVVRLRLSVVGAGQAQRACLSCRRRRRSASTSARSPGRRRRCRSHPHQQPNLEACALPISGSEGVMRGRGSSPKAPGRLHSSAFVIGLLRRAGRRVALFGRVRYGARGRPREPWSPPAGRSTRSVPGWEGAVPLVVADSLAKSRACDGLFDLRARDRFGVSPGPAGDQAMRATRVLWRSIRGERLGGRCLG